MSQLGGPLPKNEDEKEKMKIGYRYGEARDKFLDELPVVGALRENQRKISKFEAEQYAKREEEGGVGNWLLNRYSDIPDVAGQVLASPFTAASEVFNIDPRLLGDAATVFFAKKMLDKSPAAHRYMHDRGVYTRGTVNRMASDVKAVTNLVDKGLQRAGVRPRIYKGAKKPTVNNSQAYQDLVNAYPEKSQLGGFVPKAVIPKYSSGAVVQTKDGPLYRTTKPLASQFAYDTSDAELAYPGKGKRIGVRERIMADTPDAIAYRELIDKHKAILKDVKPTNINGREVKVSPLSEEELITDAAKLITLKEDLEIPSPKVYEHELGAFVKDGLVARITGGQASSNKPAAFQSKKGAKEREDREFRFTTEHDPHPDLFRDKQGSRRVQSRKAGANEADHLNILETTMPWTVTRDKTGGFVPRSEPQMKELTELMKKDYDIDLGNVNENWMMASVEAHRTGELAKHRTLASATDLQKPLLYDDADEVKLELNDGRTLWARQDGGKYYEGDVKIKPGQIKSKGNLKFQGREYEPSQMHGASLKLQDTLAAITDTKQLAESMKLFLIDSGAQEVMAGATALSSYVYDIKKDLDPLTLKIREENIPSMIKYMDTLLKLPQYKNNQVLKDLRGSFNTLWERKQEYFRLLEESYRKEGMYFRNNMNQSSIIDLNDPAMA